MERLQQKLSNMYLTWFCAGPADDRLPRPIGNLGTVSGQERSLLPGASEDTPGLGNNPGERATCPVQYHVATAHLPASLDLARTLRTELRGHANPSGMMVMVASTQ